MKRITLILTLLLSGHFLAAQDSAPHETTLTQEERLYGLSVFWSEVKRNFAFMEQVGGEARWDSLYRAFIPRVIVEQNDLSYYRELQRFCALLGDGHTGVYYPETWYKEMTIVQTEYYFRFNDFDGKVYVTGINEGKASEIPLGSELVAIDGIPVNDYLTTEIYPFLSTSASVRRSEALNQLFFAPTGTVHTVDFRLPDGNGKRLQLRNGWFEKAERVLPERSHPLFEYRELSDGIAYVALNSFDDPAIVDEFKKAFPHLRKNRGLVIDLRLNGGGNSLYAVEIISHLTRAEEFSGIREFTVEYNAYYAAIAPYLLENPQLLDEAPIYRKIAEAAQRHFKSEIPAEIVKNKEENPIEIPVAVLFGPKTCSSAEDFLIYIDPLANFFTVGEPSFGSTGQPIWGTLPGGGSYRICTKECTYPDGRKFINVGVQPDIRISPTLDDFLNDRDPVLDRAVAELHRRITTKK